jgi:predicted ester cyclase
MRARMSRAQLCTDAAWSSFHGGAPPGISPDLAGAKQLFTASWTAFPDMHATVENVIAVGDKVASRWTMRGTHQGDFMGMPPTGK